MDKMALTYSFRVDLSVAMKVDAFCFSGGDTYVDYLLFVVIVYPNEGIATLCF